MTLLIIGVVVGWLANDVRQWRAMRRYETPQQRAAKIRAEVERSRWN